MCDLIWAVLIGYCSVMAVAYVLAGIVSWWIGKRPICTYEFKRTPERIAFENERDNRYAAGPY